MSRYFHVLENDDQRCSRCERSCEIFGWRDTKTGWQGWCAICNSVWRCWKLNRILLTCTGKRFEYGLFRILGKCPVAALMFEFLRRRPQDVLTAFALQDVFASVQLEWLSFPSEWSSEDTDSEAEGSRYERPVLRTLREMHHLDHRYNPIIKCMRQPRLLDIVCAFLYLDRACSHVERIHGSITTTDMDKHDIRIYSSEDHGDTIVSNLVSRQQFDWQLYCHGHGERLWLWRISTEEKFFVHSPPMYWTRYLCPAGNFYWWYNNVSAAWFLEQILL